MSLAAAVGILQKPFPVAPVQREADRFRALLREAELLMIDGCLPHEPFVVAIFHSSPVLSPFSGRKTIGEGCQGPSRAPVFPSCLRMRVEGAVKTCENCENRYRNIFLSVHEFALLTVFC